MINLFHNFEGVIVVRLFSLSKNRIIIVVILLTFLWIVGCRFSYEEQSRLISPQANVLLSNYILCLLTGISTILLLGLSYYKIRKIKNSSLEARESSEKNLLKAQAIFNTVIDPIMTLSKDGEIDSVNPAFEVVTGYSREAIIHKNYKTLFSEIENTDLEHLESFIKIAPKKILL